MFERLKTKRIEAKIGLQRAEIDLANMEGIRPITQSGNYILPEADADDWTLITGASEKGLDEQDQVSLRTSAQKAYYKSSHGRNIIRLFEKYVAGHGFKIEPMSTMESVQEYWEEFWRVNKMQLRRKEIVRRAMRDGETFLRYFVGEKEEMIKVRFMNPEFVKNPDDKRTLNIGKETFINDGIETDIDDIETVINYYYRNKAIKAEEVQHIKILVDSDVLRGRSFYEPVLHDIATYKKWLSDRMKLNEIRNTIAIIKKVKGNPTDAANIASANETSRVLNLDGSAKARAPKNISVITTNKNVEYDLKSPNLQAADVQKDGRALLLNIAAGAGLPEYMVTSDSSNSNMASTMIAEGPAVMEFEDWQDFFAVAYKEMFYRVIESGIKKGKIPKLETRTEKEIDDNGELKEIKITEPTSTDCSITFPDLVARDIESETKALILQNNQEWISNTTAQAQLDLDHDVERDLRQKEADEKPEEEDEEFEKTKEDLEIEKQKAELERDA